MCACKITSHDDDDRFLLACWMHIAQLVHAIALLCPGLSGFHEELV